MTSHVLPDNIKETVDQMTQEFIKNNGYITCEFSLAEEHVIAMHHYIHRKNRELPSYGMWRIAMCETCKEHRADRPYHVDILVVDTRPEISE